MRVRAIGMDGLEMKEREGGQVSVAMKKNWYFSTEAFGMIHGVSKGAVRRLQAARLAGRPFWGWPPVGHRVVGHGDPSNNLGSPWIPLKIHPCFSIMNKLWHFRAD
jgi:hypothetical protein